jgi:hypothetical protein
VDSASGPVLRCSHLGGAGGVVSRDQPADHDVYRPRGRSRQGDHRNRHLDADPHGWQRRSESTWYTQVRNIGTGVITIISAGGTIDGRAAATGIVAYPGESFTIASDGTNFTTIGRQRGWIPIGSANGSAVSAIDFTWTDTELTNVRFNVGGLSVASTIVGRLSKGSGFLSASTYVTGASVDGGAAVEPHDGPSNSALWCAGTCTQYFSGVIEISNVTSTSPACTGRHL